MALPEKSYFSLLEVAKRWGTELDSVRYYAEHDELEVQTWLNDIDVDVLQIIETKNGETAFIKRGIQTYCDYAILKPIELRKVFRFQEGYAVYNFLALNGEQLLTIRNQKTRYIINITDLVISRSERDRFEQRYDICITNMKRPGAANGNTTSFAGRPSVMRRITEYFDARHAQGLTEPSLQREANMLAIWAAEHLDDAQVPKAKSIMNAIRPKYRALNSDNASAVEKSSTKSIA